MSNGKIVFVPLTQASVNLDGSHDLSIDNSDFNMGTSDFSIEAIFSPTTLSYFLSKAANYDLTNIAGWIWSLEAGLNRMNFLINDGSATGIQVNSDNSSVSTSTWQYLVITADRDSQVRFYVNSSDVGGGSISSRAGSVNNTEVLSICNQNGYRSQGYIDFLRIWKGTLLTPTWLINQWSWIQAGMPRMPYDATAYWEFNNSLVDSTANTYTLTWNGGGSAAYTTGYPTSISSTFTDNYDFGYQEGFVELETTYRSLDGTLQAYKSANKRRMTLPFKNIGKEQKWALEAAWASGNTVLFYPDAALPAYFTAKVMVPPLFVNEYANYWSGELELEEA